MAESLVIPARFNGPADSGNGGYSAGAMADLLDGPAEVSLRRPVPLDTPLEAVRQAGSLQVFDGKTLIAEAKQVPAFEIEVPDPVSPMEARQAMSRYRGLAEGPFSHCFVCGRARDDCFEVFAGAVEDRSVVASTWTPDASAADADGEVRSEFVWAVLDCPTYFATYIDSDDLPLSFLAQLTVRIDAPVPAGAEHVVISWPLEVDGRKRHAGSAVLSADGEVLARALALLIEPRPS